MFATEKFLSPVINGKINLEYLTASMVKNGTGSYPKFGSSSQVSYFFT